MFKRKRFVVGLALLSCLFLLVGCFGGNDDQKIEKKGDLLINVSVPEAIVPQSLTDDIFLSQIRLVLSNGGNSIEKIKEIGQTGARFKVEDLKPGNWTINVEGLESKPNSDEYFTIYQGNTEVVVEPNKTKNCEVSMQLTDSKGLEIDLDFPSSLNETEVVGQVKLLNASSDKVSRSINLDNNWSVVLEPLKVDLWTVQIVLRDKIDDRVVARGEKEISVLPGRLTTVAAQVDVDGGTINIGVNWILSPSQPEIKDLTLNSDGSITLDWNAVEFNSDGGRYVIYKLVDGMKEKIDTVISTNFVDKNPDYGLNKYWVQAYNVNTDLSSDLSEPMVIDKLVQNEAELRDVLTDTTYDTIYLGSKTYVGQFEIERDLTLIGQGSSTVIKAPETLETKWDASTAERTKLEKPILFVTGNVDVTMRDLVIDGAGRGESRFYGILMKNSDGLIENVEVKDVREEPLSGNQHGVAIRATVTEGTTHKVTVRNCHLYGYQKNGMTFDGSGLEVDVRNNTLSGAGPIDITAQNGIQVSYGSGGTITGNTVSGHVYTPATWSASGILLWEDAEGTEAYDNTYLNNQINIYDSDYTYVATNTELRDALATETETIVIYNDITLDNQLTIDRPVIIDGSGYEITSNSTGYGIYTGGINNVTFKNFTLVGPDQGANSNYGFKIEDASGVTFQNISVKDSYKSGIDLNRVSDSNLDNIIVSGVTKGSGIQLTDSINTRVSNVDLSNNGWGNISVQAKYKDYITDGNIALVLSGNNFYDPAMHDIYTETNDAGSTISIDNLDLTDSAISYHVYTPDKPKFEYYFETAEEANTFADYFTESTVTEID